MTIPILSKANLMQEVPMAGFPEDFNLNDHFNIVESSKEKTVVEAQSTDSFLRQWYERQRFELLAGRVQEPLLYQPIYQGVPAGSSSRHIDVNTLGPGGIAFKKVEEGGEVKFATFQNDSNSVEVMHYAAAIEMSKDIFKFNELYKIPLLERAVGVAYNALLNHIHLSPFITHNYVAAQQTDGTALVTFNASDDLAVKYLRTLDQAIVDAQSDKTWKRNGPYVLLCSVSSASFFERALNRVPQQGVDMQASSTLNTIRNIIAYNGWSTRIGKKEDNYPGVPIDKAYLIDIGNKASDFLSFISQAFERAMAQGDMSRFILEQIIYDCYFAVYVQPRRAVQEITLPGASDGKV